MRPSCLLALVVLAGCQREEPAPPLKALAPAPLLPLQAVLPADAGREAAYQVRPAAVFGQPVPAAAVRLLLRGSEVQVASDRFDVSTAEGCQKALAVCGNGAVLLVPDADTYLAQLAPLLATLDDAGTDTWLLHPSGKVAFHLALRDAAAFDTWLHVPRPGALRIIQRQDGLELVSNVGKLPGSDANGPTVPRRGGQLDVALAREGLERLKSRFLDADTLCVVPSFATEVRETGALLSAAWASADGPLFATLCLVYPRPPGWREAPASR
jgi:hypothetical protein